MDTIVEIIKRMLTKGLDISERLQLSRMKSMEALLSEQWDEKSDKHIQDQVDFDKMWRSITAICWGANSSNNMRNKKIRHLRIGYSIAVVIVLLLFGTWVAKSISDSYVTVKALATDRLTLVLPDGSSVWLNAGSELRYSKNFSVGRTVELSGEAFFDVVKMAESPFKVKIQDAYIVVKGTEFNVKSSFTTLEVALFSGKVVFGSEELRQQFEMSPSERILYDMTSHNVSVSKIDLEEYDWRSTEFRFRNKPFADLVRFINRTYGVNIILKDIDCEKDLFTGIIRKTETLSDVLNKICICFELQQKQDGHSIILY